MVWVTLFLRVAMEEHIKMKSGSLFIAVLIPKCKSYQCVLDLR